MPWPVTYKQKWWMGWDKITEGHFLLVTVRPYANWSSVFSGDKMTCLVSQLLERSHPQHCEQCLLYTRHSEQKWIFIPEDQLQLLQPMTGQKRGVKTNSTAHSPSNPPKHDHSLFWSFVKPRHIIRIYNNMILTITKHSWFCFKVLFVTYQTDFVAHFVARSKLCLKYIYLLPC